MIIAGDPAAETTRHLVVAAQRSFSPNLVLILADPTPLADGDRAGQESEEAPLFREVLKAYGEGVYGMGEGGVPAAFVCFDNSCSRPVHTAEALKDLL